MAYIGNPPAEAYTNTVKDTFSGDGSTTVFTMTHNSLTNDVRVVVENVVQDPTVAYSCSGTTLTFTSAPPVGTNNIYVVHLGPAVMTTLPPAEIAQATTFNSNVSVGGNLIVDTNTLYVDSANNKVGIGTSSPSALIHASGAAASGGAVEIRLEDTAASSNSRLMRTGSAYSYAGVGANETWLYHAGAGTINIGPDGAGTVKIVNGGSERMRITTDKVQFNVDAKVDADNARDLGAGGARWKDLYLSGGVYVGGTGAANYLDDYEEGTYYPELTSSGGSFSSVTYNTQLGNYVIVGDIIHVAGNIGASAISGGSGTLYITLPASCPSGIGGAGGVVGYISGLNYNSPTFNQVGLYISNGGGALLKFTCSGDDTSAIETPISNFTSVFNCTFQVSYRIT